MPCSMVFFGTYVRLTLILLRSIQHAVCNFQCFFVGLNLPSDIKHGRNSASDLVVLHVTAYFGLSLTVFCGHWPLRISRISLEFYE
mgnify:CR=1 FL=1